MGLSEDKIEKIAQRKVEDYMQDVLVKHVLQAETDASVVMKAVHEDALKSCVFNDSDISKEDLAALQNALKQEIDRYFKAILRKVEGKTEEF